MKPGSFFPVPKVDSVVLSFTPLAVPRVEVGDEQFFRRVVKAAFGQRRKTLWNCLRSLRLELDDRGIGAGTCRMRHRRRAPRRNPLAR